MTKNGIPHLSIFVVKNAQGHQFHIFLFLFDKNAHKVAKSAKSVKMQCQCSERPQSMESSAVILFALDFRLTATPAAFMLILGFFFGTAPDGDSGSSLHTCSA